MKNILIIGGAGYIGSHVVLEFCNKGENVFVFDNLSTGDFKNIDSRAQFINGSILNKEQLDLAFVKVNPSTVLHFASLKAAGESMDNPDRYSETNIIGSLNILNTMVKHGVKNIIFSSTAAVYGKPNYLHIDENHPTNPINFYGFTKKTIEDFITWYSNLKGINYAILRYFNAAGYDPKGRIKGLERNPQNLLPIIMEILINKRTELNIFGNDYDTADGTCERDYIHVSDLATAHYLSYQNLIRNNGNILFNLATGDKYSVLDVVNGCEKYLGKKIKYKFTKRRKGDSEVLFSKSSLAESKLGWRPQNSDLKSLLTSMYHIYKNRG